jgi:signal transduction histidine kinase
LTVPEPGRLANRLLIVDDESTLRIALCRALEGAGYPATSAGSGSEALTLLRTAISDGVGGFDALITDLMMPEMDGIALLRAAQEVDRDLVAIVMTGHGTIDTAIEAMKSGATDFILKPFNLIAIMPVLTRALTIRQLRLQNAALLRRVMEHAAQLEIANRALQDTNNELDAFTSTLSHDVRAPLGNMVAFAEVLISEADGPLADKQKEYLQDIRDSGVTLINLADDLLRFSRLSHAGLKREQVNVTALVREVVGDLQEGPGRVQGLELRIGELPSVQADRALLKQVFVNLLSNAYKFTRRAPRPLIEISGERCPLGCRYRVRDNGAGFDMTEAAELFKLFRRLHSAQDFEGTGVGLSIVQRIVERHGGVISATAEVGKGAQFVFTLPGS